MASEEEAVRGADAPRTRESLAGDLRALGLRVGETVLVHTSLSRLGWVAGGAVGVIQALLDALGPEGTLVMPAFSSTLSDPRHWENPPVPESWWPVIREHMPAFDPDRTPTEHVGRVPETFRSWPGVTRSGHPQSSFAALGPRAAAILSGHGPPGSSFGPDSPLGALRDQGARVLLLGTGFEVCTAFHLAEVETGASPRRQEGAPVLRDGARTWVTFEDLDYSSEGFAEIGARVEQEGRVRAGRVGSATARLFSLPEAVEVAARAMRAARGGGP